MNARNSYLSEQDVSAQCNNWADSAIHLQQLGLPHSLTTICALIKESSTSSTSCRRAYNRSSSVCDDVDVMHAKKQKPIQNSLRIPMHTINKTQKGKQNAIPDHKWEQGSMITLPTSQKSQRPQRPLKPSQRLNAASTGISKFTRDVNARVEQFETLLDSWESVTSEERQERRRLLGILERIGIATTQA
jgi:hypothetical protein